MFLTPSNTADFADPLMVGVVAMMALVAVVADVTKHFPLTKKFAIHFMVERAEKKHEKRKTSR